MTATKPLVPVDPADPAADPAFSSPSPAGLTPPGSRGREPRVKSGLRLQIVVALAALMLLAFVPLFFAVASLTRATIVGSREQAARAVGRAIATHVADVRSGDASGGVVGSGDARGGDAHRGDGSGDGSVGDRAAAIRRALAEHAGQGGIEAICVFANGALVACDGAPSAVAALAATDLPAGPLPAETVRALRGTTGRSFQVVTRAGDAIVVTRLDVDADADRGTPLVRLVALYMVVFALALLVFAYFALTRLIVRPVEHLVDAANRVANGARTLPVPRSGASELVELGASVQEMAEKLIAEEAALIVKVEELTDTTRRLTDTRAQLVRSERMASVGRLAAGLAHEIGNPIAALMGMEDLLLEGGLDADAQRDFLQRMRRETERIHVVVRDLLAFARPEGPSEAEAGPPVPADVAAVADDVVALARPQKIFRALRIEIEVPASLRVALPASRLTQVLLNLVLNAGAAIVGARGEGAGRIVIRARAASAERARIEVEDDGPGIAPAVRDRLFEPFVTTKEVGAGTGLGLAVCRGLVESAGGEIGVDPDCASGARFYVVLPLAP